jgi:hypothetical protein
MGKIHLPLFQNVVHLRILLLKVLPTLPHATATATAAI